MNEDLHGVLREMASRLSAIEAALQAKSCDRHEAWLKNHEGRIQSSEMKINAIWIALVLCGGLLGYLIEAVLNS